MKLLAYINVYILRFTFLEKQDFHPLFPVCSVSIYVPLSSRLGPVGHQTCLYFACIYVFIFVCVCIFVYVYMYVYVNLQVCPGMVLWRVLPFEDFFKVALAAIYQHNSMYIYIHTYIYTNTYTYTYTYTYVYVRFLCTFGTHICTLKDFLRLHQQPQTYNFHTSVYIRIYTGTYTYIYVCFCVPLVHKIVPFGTKRVPKQYSGRPWGHMSSHFLYKYMHI